MLGCHYRRSFLRLALIALVAVVAVALPQLPAAEASDAQPRVKPRASVKSGKRAPRGRSARSRPRHIGKAYKTTTAITITKFPSGTPLGTVRQALRCLLDFDESSGFDCYVPINAELNRHNANARTHLRRYQWRHFRKFGPSYVGKGKVFSLRMTRQVPAKPTPKTNRVKIFLVSRHRDNPAPITLQREGNRWLIYNNSL